MRVQRSVSLVLLLTGTQPAHAGEWRLSIRGNARSSNAYVESVLRRCLTTLPDAQTNALEQCLMNTRQFSRVAITRDAADSFDVEVEDRWTLIALPLYLQNSAGERTLGAFAIDSNFLGQGKTLMLGALWSTQGMFASFGLQDRAIGFSQWRGGVFATRARSEARLRPDGHTVEDAFQEDSFTSGANIGYEFTGGWSPQLGCEWNTRTYKELEESFPPPQKLDALKGTLGVQWHHSNYRLFFDEGTNVNAGISTTLWKSNGLPSLSADVRMTHGIATWGEQALLLNAQAITTTGDDKRDVRRLGGGPGLRGFLSGSLWAKQWGALAADYQIPLWQTGTGTWTLAPFVDVGAVRTTENKGFAYVAEGLGSYFFLKRVSLPGMGFIMGYNQTTQRLLTQFTLGMSGPF